MSGALARGAERQQARAFNPADWVGEATRHVDVAEGAEPLLGVLAMHDAWVPSSAQDPHRNDVVQRLADALKPRTPLYELTAALIAPYLTTTLGAPAGADGGLRGDPAAIRANLHEAMGHLFSSPATSGYDPWTGLAEWLWSHQTAWAVAAMQQQLGRESVRTLTTEEYR